MLRHIIIAFLMCTFISWHTSAQLTLDALAHLQISRTSEFDKSSENPFAFTDAKFNNKYTSILHHKQPLPKINNKTENAFFCKVEGHFEKISNLAPRFRLGSLDYVNYLEGRQVYWVPGIR